MAKKPETTETTVIKPERVIAEFWIVGMMPLICHAWSEKAKHEMLQKQIKAVKGKGRETRDPEADFANSLYDLGGGAYGFPAMAFKKAILSVAHKDKGIARTDVAQALYLDAEMVRVRPALAGAICDLPLVRLYGSKPEMREDMVRVGSGLNKTATLAYRGQFTHWACKLRFKLNKSAVTEEQLAFLVEEAGIATGVGDWRNEKSGVFGAFRLATASEARAWAAFATGNGPMPINENYQEAAE
jgi:hypothetical protein